MTDQLMATLKKNYTLAKESGDNSRINDAQEAMHWAEMECQAHTSERVKRIERDVIDIKSQIVDIKSDISRIREEKIKTSEDQKKLDTSVNMLRNELRSIHDKGKGMYLVLRCLYCFLAGGGAVAAVKLFKMMGWI